MVRLDSPYVITYVPIVLLRSEIYNALCDLTFKNIEHKIWWCSWTFHILVCMTSRLVINSNIAQTLPWDTRVYDISDLELGLSRSPKSKSDGVASYPSIMYMVCYSWSVVIYASTPYCTAKFWKINGYELNLTWSLSSNLIVFMQSPWLISSIGRALMSGFEVRVTLTMTQKSNLWQGLFSETIKEIYARISGKVPIHHISRAFFENLHFFFFC